LTKSSNEKYKLEIMSVVSTCPNGIFETPLFNRCSSQQRAFRSALKELKEEKMILLNKFYNGLNIKLSVKGHKWSWTHLNKQELRLLFFTKCCPGAELVWNPDRFMYQRK